MIAADIMTENVRVIGPDETIAEAVEILHTLDVRHLPVVNDEDELVGMLSDRDLRGLVMPYDAEEDEPMGATPAVSSRMPVSKIMTGNVVAVDTETDVEEIVERILEDRVGALPVIDGENKVVGIISYVDVLRSWLAERREGGETSTKRGASAASKAKPVAKSSAKKAAKKPVAKKAAAKKVTKAKATKKAAKKAAPKKSAKKAATKKAAGKKSAAKKPAKKSASKKR